MDPVSGNPGPACDDYPSQANATSSSTTLIWWALSPQVNFIRSFVSQLARRQLFPRCYVALFYSP
eukprot:COSAG06_NODE_8318_length_2204_cov_3.265907_2_plen_65_part_00